MEREEKRELAQRDNKTIFYYAVCLPNNESIEVKSRVSYNIGNSVYAFVPNTTDI